jgi:hypothetical protein
LKDKIKIYNANNLTYTKEFKIHNKHLKFVQRNNCFSIKRKIPQIKRQNPNNAFYKIHQSSPLVLPLAGAIFVTHVKDYYTMSLLIPSVFSTEQGDIFEVKHIIDKRLYYDKIMQDKLYDRLGFYLKYQSTFAKKDIDYIKNVLIDLIDRKTKYKPFKKSKRSKILCFVSSQK